MSDNDNKEQPKPTESGKTCALGKGGAPMPCMDDSDLGLPEERKNSKCSIDSGFTGTERKSTAGEVRKTSSSTDLRKGSN